MSAISSHDHHDSATHSDGAKVIVTTLEHPIQIHLWEDRTRGELWVPTFDPAGLELLADDYLRIAVAAAAVREGAAFVATNADLRYPTPRGFLPGAGSLVAAIKAASGDVEPIVVGKPQPMMFAEILEDARLEPEAAVVVGDNPDADIVAAHRSGIFSVLILTGVADAALAEGLTGERQPDVVAADHPSLARLFDAWLS